MLKVDLSRDAAKFLRRLPPKHGRQVAAKITLLRDDPTPPDSSLLKGATDELRRADIGEYRIVYEIDGDTLRVVVVGKRNDDDVYRKLTRKPR